MSKEYRDPNTLRELYWGKGLTLKDISDRFGCDERTIFRWMERHEIPRRAAEVNTQDEDYRDPDILRRLYHDEGLSLREVASRLGCDQRTVRTWMKHNEIETRSKKEALSIQYVPYGCDNLGYERWKGSVGETLRVHQLLAISEGISPHIVFGGDAHVHHKNGITWDNRPENIEVLSKGEHIKLHGDERTDAADPDNTYRSKHWLRNQYIHDSKSTLQISKDVGASPSTIKYWINKHGLRNHPASDRAGHESEQTVGGEH